MQKPRVVILVEYYLPGFRAGGPMRSVSALVEQLGDEIDFYVITRDRDAGNDAAYPDFHAGEWKSVGKGKVLYLAPHEMSSRRLVAAAREIQPHAVYLNGFFGPMSVRLLLARRLGALKGIPVLLAPRGELSPGALRLKAFKKGSFLRLSHWTELHRDVVFHASTERERDEIAQAISVRDMPRIARNPVAVNLATSRACSKKVGAARFVFLSRIARKKNLHLAIELLRHLKGSVEFDIYGPVLDQTDQAYWRQCYALIGEMPPNVTVDVSRPDRTRPCLVHAVGAPILPLPDGEREFRSRDRRGASRRAVQSSRAIRHRGSALRERGVGWDLPLDDTDAWRHVLQMCVDMDAETYETASLNARSFGHQIASTDTVAENLHLFRSMLEEQRGVRNSPGVSVA